MLIHRILNNNAVISMDDSNHEIIVTGKGIAFKKSVYDEIDPDTILKIYVPKDKKEKSRLEALVSEIPYDYFAAAEYIKKKGEKDLGLSLDDGLSIRLADHIHYAVQKLARNISSPNLMLNELQHFYQKEYEVGLWAISYINKQFDSTFDEHEAGFIAFHIVSCEDENGRINVNEVLDRMQIITNFIDTYPGLALDEESPNYTRLVTHLKFFIQKMLSQNPEQEQSLKNDSLFLMLIDKYAPINAFLDDLSALLDLKYNYELTDSDRMYLIIHIARLVR